jgi:hypothetical protein
MIDNMAGLSYDCIDDRIDVWIDDRIDDQIYWFLDKKG